MSKKQEKTNVMRLLDKKKAIYEFLSYDNSKVNAVDVANTIHKDVNCVFKTLVTVGKSKEHYVFMVPCHKELDLKKAAKAASEKSIEMLPQKELLGLTGYIHGGCSPIGMKKQFKTFIDQSALDKEKICFSGGRIGHQVEMNISELRKLVDVKGFDIVKDISGEDEEF